MPAPEPSSEMSTSRLRSSASASAPLTSATLTIGTNSHAPSAPTASVDPVRSYIWNGSATNVIIEPKNETSWPRKSSRNSRPRSGLRSSRRPRNAPIVPDSRPREAPADRHPAPRGRARRALARVPGPGARGRRGRLRLELARRPPALPRRRPAGARAVGGVDAARRARRRHGARDARRALRVRLLPPAGADRQDGRHGRRGERRPLRARAGRGLERDGIPRLRAALRPARLALRRGLRDRARAARRGARHGGGLPLAG